VAKWNALVQKWASSSNPPDWIWKLNNTAATQGGSEQQSQTTIRATTLDEEKRNNEYREWKRSVQENFNPQLELQEAWNRLGETVKDTYEDKELIEDYLRAGEAFNAAVDAVY
jgi:hypothetical protein